MGLNCMGPSTGWVLPINTLVTLRPTAGLNFRCESQTRAAAAAAKSLQSCPTLCDSIDRSPPGSPVPGILQARTLQWVAISFSNASKWKVKGKSLSRIRLLATPWTAAYQASPSMGFSRQEYWSGVPLPSPQMREADYKFTLGLLTVRAVSTPTPQLFKGQRQFSTKCDSAAQGTSDNVWKHSQLSNDLDLSRAGTTAETEKTCTEGINCPKMDFSCYVINSRFCQLESFFFFLNCGNKLKIGFKGTSLAAQWLRICLLMPGHRFELWWRTRIPHAAGLLSPPTATKDATMKMPRATTKTRHSQR